MPATAKGFMFIRPASRKGRPEAATPFVLKEPENYSLRRYAEQWDVMFLCRVAEMICGMFAGLATRTMRFCRWRQSPGANNVGIVVPPGVAHAIRVEGSEDVIMVYGTSTSFRPEFEGRIASEVETASLPESWERFLGRSD